MKRYHCALLAAVTESMFLCRASSSCCSLNSPSGIPRALASSLLPIAYVFEFPHARCRPCRIAAFRQLFACSKGFRKGLYGGKHFKLCVWGGDGQVSMGRRSVKHNAKVRQNRYCSIENRFLYIRERSIFLYKPALMFVLSALTPSWNAIKCY